MENMIRWTPENRKILTDMYDAGKSDVFIGEYFKARKWSIAKQRSILGLVPYKRRKGLKRGPKKLEQVSNHLSYVVHYKQDNVNHFSFVNRPDILIAKELAKNILRKKDVHYVTVLKPITQFVSSTFKEIEL